MKYSERLSIIQYFHLFRNWRKPLLREKEHTTLYISRKNKLVFKTLTKNSKKVLGLGMDGLHRQNVKMDSIKSKMPVKR